MIGSVLAEPLSDPDLAWLESYLTRPATRLALDIPSDAPLALTHLHALGPRDTYVVEVSERRMVIETLRLPDSERAFRKLAREFAVLEWLEPYQVAAAPLMLDISGREVPFPVMARRFLEGVRLGDANDLLDAIEALGNLHAVPVDSAHPLAELERPLYAILERANEVLAQPDSSGTDGNISLLKLIARICARLEERVEADETMLAEASKTVVHGRAWIDRVVVGSAGPRLIQVGAARLDHPSADLCRLVSPIWFQAQGQLVDEQFQRAALEAYLRALPLRLDGERLLELVTRRMPYVMLDDLVHTITNFGASDRRLGGQEVVHGANSWQERLDLGAIEGYFSALEII